MQHTPLNLQIPVWTAALVTLGTGVGMYFLTDGYLHLTFLVAALCGVNTYFGLRRLLFGPQLLLEEWTVFFALPPAALAAEGVAPKAGPSVGELAAGLAKHGYAPQFSILGPDGLTLSEALPGQRLLGVTIVIRDPKLPTRNGRIKLALSPPVPDQELAVGLIDVEDRMPKMDEGTNPYGELAQFVIVQLAELLPGLTYKQTMSSESPEPVEKLRWQLPDRPLHLR